MKKLTPKHQLGGPQYFQGGLPTPQEGIEQNKKNTRIRLYRNVKPQGYQNFTLRLIKGLMGQREANRDTATPQENAMWARYLNLSPEETGGLDWKDYLEETDKRPTKGNINKSRPYYKIIKGHNPLTDDDYSEVQNGQSTTVIGNEAGMGTYTIGKREDGTKTYHDVWDINPMKGISSKVPGIIQKFIPDFDLGKLIGAQEYGIYDAESQ